MKYISVLNDSAAQKFQYQVLSGYDLADITLYFKPRQYGWFMNISWANWSTKQLKIVKSPNILRQYKNIIPFGIQINGPYDPITYDAWVNGIWTFNMLDQSEVSEIELAYVRN